MPDLLTLQEVADRLGVHYQTAWRLADSGELGAYKIRGAWRVSEEHLSSYLDAARRTNATSDKTSGSGAVDE